MVPQLFQLNETYPLVDGLRLILMERREDRQAKQVAAVVSGHVADLSRDVSLYF